MGSCQTVFGRNGGVILELLTLVFALLFVAQTVIFIIVYRRAVTRHAMKSDVTHVKSGKTDTPVAAEKPFRESEDVGRVELHSSAIAALRLIRERGGVISSDVSRELNLSREHAARLMKQLYEMGLVDRSGKPFKYSLTEKGAALVNSTVTRDKSV